MEAMPPDHAGSGSAEDDPEDACAVPTDIVPVAGASRANG
jgi:hypothetical protein